jgi:hypothetical protein
VNNESRPKAAPEIPPQTSKTSVTDSPEFAHRGEQVKRSESGIDRSNSNMDPVFASNATQRIKWCIDNGQSFTVDVLGDIPRPDHSCRVGSLFAALRRSKIIEEIGAEISPVDGRLVRRWRGVRP